MVNWISVKLKDRMNLAAELEAERESEREKEVISARSRSLRSQRTEKRKEKIPLTNWSGFRQFFVSFLRNIRFKVPKENLRFEIS